MTISVSIDTSKVTGALAKLTKELGVAVREETKQYAREWQQAVSLDSIGPGGKGKRGGGRLHNRTGALRRSVRWKQTRDRVRMTVGGADAPHAVTQELGGVIRPRRRKYLTVPLPNALTASGAQSGKYRIRARGGRFETDAGPTFIFRSKKGNLIVAVRRKNRKAFDAKRDSLYVLKRSVKIPPRLKAWETAQLDSPVGRHFRMRLTRRINILTRGRG